MKIKTIAGRAALALIPGTALLFSPLTPHPEALASCGASGHSYVAVTSSTSSGTIGTGGWTYTWPSGYSIHNNGINFSDEAEWIISATDGTALEGGFFSGAGAPGSGLWTDGMMPYYTTNNGANEYDDTGNYLQYNNNIWVAVTAAYGGSGAFVQVGSHDMNPGSYSVTSPRTNYAQSEVYDTNDNPVLMGGSSSSPGEQWNESWEDTSRNFYAWGNYTKCSDSGYGFSGDYTQYWHNWGGQNT